MARRLDPNDWAQSYVMKADLTEQIDEVGTNETVPAVADPFAIDLFASSRAPIKVEQLPSHIVEATAADSIAAAPPENYLWSSRLPRVTASQWRLSESLAAMPRLLLAPNVIEVIAGTLARYTHVQTGQFAIMSLAPREAELSEVALRPGAAMPRVFAALAVEPEDTQIAIELNCGFAAAIIDRVLGGDGASPDGLRPLSISERAVIEFLLISIVHEVNKLCGQPLFKFVGLEAQPPAWLMVATTTNESERGAGKRGIVAAARVQCAELTGVVRLYFAQETLRALDAARNPLLQETREHSARERIERFKQFAPDATLRLDVGETDIAAGDLAELEVGDCIIVERQRVAWRQGSFEDELRFHVGDGSNVQLTGRAAPRQNASQAEQEPSGDVAAATTAISLAVDGFLVGETVHATERLKMQDEQRNDEETSADDGATAVLDGMLLTVHVELAARRISLDELARLRPGQILNLDCKATDPVDLVHEGRRLARGELVDIEGSLGVRITQIAG